MVVKKLTSRVEKDVQIHLTYFVKIMTVGKMK